MCVSRHFPLAAVRPNPNTVSVMESALPLIKVYPDRAAASQSAAQHAAQIIRDAIAARGQARIIAATGASQIDFV